MRARAAVLACAIAASVVASTSGIARAEPATQDLTAPGAQPAAPSTTTPATPSPTERPIVVWPTLTPAGDEVGATPLHKPGPTEGGI